MCIRDSAKSAKAAINFESGVNKYLKLVKIIDNSPKTLNMPIQEQV